MRVLIVNTSERTGGAAIAANRLMHALNNNGTEARMLVRDRKTDAAEVVNIPQSWRLKANFLWERGVIWLANNLSKHNIFQVDIANCGTDITGMDAFNWADVIHLHWVNQGFLSLDDHGPYHGLGQACGHHPARPVVFHRHLPLLGHLRKIQVSVRKMPDAQGAENGLGKESV